ncbi:MAG: AlpA family phage regulatory protein [Pseudomonadota bacterium]
MSTHNPTQERPATAASSTPLDELLREPEVLALTKLSRSQRYRLIAEGLFPAPVKIGKRASAWKASAIRVWLDGLQSANKEQGQ